ncbi:MAG: hypothetical protein KKH83_08890 [Candidatus Margulisbacteria bacterium]|nr:hypothetical protein [Candidatus Margulisiibacteriota bacterium]
MKKMLFMIPALLFAACTLAAEEIPVHPHTINKDKENNNGVGVNIKAEKLKYIQETGIVIASGSVEVEIEGLHIHSDSLTMNTTNNVVTAEGNITMYGGPLDYHATSSFITYNVSSETASFRDFRTKTSPSNISGTVYLQAQDIEDQKTRMLGKEGILTTCDYAEHGRPHYITTARKIEYYPDDKIVGYWVSFYEQWIGKVWMGGSPYLVYDLKKRNKKNWVIGQNQVEGWFLKTAWDWPLGLLYFDYMEKKGFGYGVSFEQKDSSAYFYQIEEKDTKLLDSVIKLNKKYQVTDQSTLDLSYNASNIYLIPSGRMDQSEIKANFNHSSDRMLASNLSLYESRTGNTEKLAYSLQYTKDKSNTSYSANIDQGKDAVHSIRIAQRFNHSRPLFRDSTSFKTNISYFDNIARAGEYGDERLEPEIEIVDRYDNFTLRYYQNWHLDLDQGLYTGDDNDQFMETQPEITLSFKTLDLRLFNLDASTSYGWYREVKYVPGWGYNRDYATSRYQTSLSASKSLPLALGTTLALGAGMTQNLYQPGDALYVFTEDAALETDLASFLKNKLTYKRGIAEGNSPFYFDRVGTRYNNYKDQLTLYYGDKINWQTEGGYNWETEQHFNLISSLIIKPGQVLNLNFKSGYDIENSRYLDLSSSANFNPFPWLLTTLSVLSDLNTGNLRSASSLLDLEVGSEENWQNHWHLKFSHSYNSATQRHQLRDIMVVKDLHCWEVKYTYSDYRKEFSLIFTLKALPNEPIGYATGRGFYYEGFDKALDKEIKGDSPKRY